MPIETWIIGSARNRKAYQDLVDLIRSRSSLAFVGAGVTCPLEYPSWSGLIDRLATEVRATSGEEFQCNGVPMTVEKVVKSLKEKPLVQAQLLKDRLGLRYFDVIKDLFGPNERRFGPISDLVSLPFCHLLTSNYDPGLKVHFAPGETPEWFCLYQPLVQQFLDNLNNQGYARHIVYLHGRYNEPERITLTQTDYSLYVRDAAVKHFWGVMATTTRFVFFGFSLLDTDLMSNFRDIKMLWATNGVQQNNRHFAILPFTSEQDEEAKTVDLNMEYRIEPGFYPNKSKKHLEYNEFISHLKADVLGSTPNQLTGEPAAAAIPQTEPVPVVAPPAEMIAESVEHLKLMTQQNIAQYQVGDLDA